MSEVVTVESDAVSGIVTVTICRPEVRNALDAVATRELASVLERWVTEPSTRVLVLRGKGLVFCAGADIGWLAEASVDQVRKQVLRPLRQVFESLMAATCHTVAVVQGGAYGGGAGLAAACDTVIASSDATFSLSEEMLGLAPALIVPYVVSRVGQAAGRRLFLSGEKIDAHRALTLGLVDYVATPDGLEDQFATWCKILERTEPVAVASTRKLLNEVASGNIARYADHAEMEFLRLLDRPCVRETLSKFHDSGE
jgi:methylglutaconyl-CoA hydratase